MKKAFSILTLALLLFSFSACTDNDDDEQVYSFNSQQLNKSSKLSDPADMKVSSSTATVKWTYAAESHITITSEILVNENTTAKLLVSNVLMNYDATNGRFEFSAPSGGDGITQVKGYFGVNSDALTFYVEFVYNNTYKVTSVAQLTYPFVNAMCINTENPGAPYQNDDMGFIIVVKPSDMTAQMRFTNVKFADNDSHLDYITVTEGLTVVPTVSGYKVTGSNLETEVSGYTIDDFEANVTNNGLNVNGTFLANGKYSVSFSGSMFGVLNF